MYTIDREKAAEMLDMSTRTIDRYIRSWKLRSQKRGKKVFLNAQDVEILKSWGIQEEYEIITPKEKSEESWFVTKALDNSKNYKNLYEDSMKMIEKKDEIIKDLSYKLWKAEVELKNSVPMLEYKKATYLLESTTTKTEEDKKEVQSNIDNLKDNLRTQQLLNIVLIWIFSIMVLVVFFVWFANI